nr:doublecortin domain-containing protein 2 isoform X15 [Crassostrea gigas]
MKKTHPLPPIDRKREELPPDERELPHGKIIKMYKNGDKFRPAKPILFNESHFSSWEIFLDEVQEKLKFERPVRSIYTPEGGTEVYTFEQIQDDHAYVAASGKFEPFRYTAIESHSPRPSKINKSNFNSRIEPVVHSRIRQDARFRQSQTLASRAKRITVAINNDDIDHSHVVLIPAKKVNNLQAIIETIDDDLNNNRGIQFRVEYLVDTDTEEVCTHPEDIIEDHIYVACNKGRRYIPKTYSKDGRKNFVVIPSPRPLQRPKFIWERSNLNGSRDNKRPSEFYTLRTLPPIGSKNYKGSPDNSVTSNPEYGSRKKPHQANGAIHTKPQKHKRTPEKKAKQTDYDKDDGGVFKAKDTNKHTKGAREVGETKDTRTDLPIDQVPAEEVKEETLYEEENTAKVPSEITLTHKQSAEGEEDDEIYDHHDDHYDDNDDEDEKIKSQKTPKETTHKTNSKTNNNNTNNNNTNNNKTNNNNNTNNKTNPKPADHSHGAKDPAPKKHSGTRGEFNNVSPLPGIGKNDTNRSSTPVGRNGFDSPTQQEKDLAAAKIQANYRGHKTRQELAKQKEGTKKNDAANKPPDTKMDAASKPPDTKKDAGKKPESKTKEDEAATKIQAGFRGHKTRQDLKKKKENQQDDKANAQQDQKQQNAPSAQSNNPAPSQSDQTAPKGNQTAPKADQTAPKADQTAPKGDQTAPKADQAAPKADQTAPKGDQTAPKGDQTAPKADQTAPKGDQTAPKTDQTAPKGDQTAPNADQTNPKGDQTAPKGDQTAPKGDQTAPKGDQTAPKGDNAAQKTDGTSQKGVKRPSTAGSSKPPSTAGP